MLEKHRYQCESTLDQLLNTVREGEELSKRLLLESKHFETTKRVDVDKNYPQKSLQSVEGLLEKLNVSKAQLEKLWHGKQRKLDYWVQLKTFERELHVSVKRQTEWTQSWASKTLAVDFTKSQIMLQRFTTENHEMDRGLKSICNRGEHILQVLQECGVQVSLADDKGIEVDSLTYMKSTLKSLGDQKIELLASRKAIQKKLEQSVQLRRLELDAKRVAGWIRHGENILQANVEAGSSLVEAEALLREYEQFQIAIEVCFKILCFISSKNLCMLFWTSRF